MSRYVREPADEESYASGPEIILDAEAPIIDCHHHLWDRKGQTYLSQQFLADVSGHNLISTVYVECLNSYRETGEARLRPIGETEFVIYESDLPRRNVLAAKGLCDGIVGFADLSLGLEVETVLAAHVHAGKGRFRGVRYATAYDPDPGIHSAYDTWPNMLNEPGIIEGARVLGRWNLSLDTWVYFHQIEEVAALADACPETRIILNHCGGPIGIASYKGRRAEVFAAWESSVKDLATRENVTLKFGGLAMALAGFAWHRMERPPTSEELADAWRPYFEACVATFGPSRMMFESNFPVDRTGCSYATLWNAFKRLSAGGSQSERKDLLARTAAKIYRI